MKVTFLGTSHGLPEKERMCTCTMLETEGKTYIVDMGAPFADIAARRGIPYENIKSVFITHPHQDHYAGLISFLWIAKWHRPESTVQVWLPDEMLVNGLAPILDASPESSNTKIGTHLYGKGLFYDDGTLKAEALPNDHMKNVGNKSYGFKITAGNKKLLFTGDLTADMHDFPQEAFDDEYDLVVTECAHAAPQTLEAKLSNIKTKLCFINHIYPFEKMDYLGALDGKFGYKIVIGKDFDTVEI